MIIFVGLLALIAVLGLRKADGKERDYMSVAMTNSIKGIFLCFVFFSHIWGYQEFSHPVLDGSYMFLKKMGQCIVVMFLFYSGYGVMESVKKKGEEYVKGIPVQRVLKVLLLFDSAILLFWLYGLYIGNHYDAKNLLLTFLGWNSIGNSNWYIFSILWLYMFTFLAFRVFRKDYLKAVVGIIMLSLLYMVILCKMGKEYWWYDTVLCYAWGMLFSLYRSKIESFVNGSRRSWLFFLSVSVIGYLSTYFYRTNNHVVYQLWVFCFFAAIVIFTMRFVIDSKPLQWLGRNLFPLYILQRLPMTMLRDVDFGVNAYINNWIYVAVCFVATVVIAFVYQKTIAKAIGKLTAAIYQKTKVSKTGKEPERGQKAKPVSRITSDKDDFSNLSNGNRFLGTPPILKNSVIDFVGKNNILFCEENVRLDNCNLSFKGDHSIIYLSSSKDDYKINATLFHDSVCFVGKDNYFNGTLNVILSEQRHLFIGARGVFSFGIWIRNADPHLVYSAETMERLNPTRSIFIGEHVWIGQSAMILKGSQIGDGSIVGAMSLVAGKKIPSNTSWGGNPVKLLREGIFWDGSCVHTWTQEKTEKSRNYKDDKYIFKDSSARISYDEIDQKISEAKDAEKRLDYLLEIKNNFGC